MNHFIRHTNSFTIFMIKNKLLEKKTENNEKFGI